MNPPANHQPAGAGAGGHFRWFICGLLFFAIAVIYVDRLVIGILKVPLCARFGWSDAVYGHIAAAFSFAYAFGYLIGGRSIDWLGARRGLPIFVTVWSLAAAAHGLCGLIGVQEQFRMRYPWFSAAEGGFAMVTLALPLTAAAFIFARMFLGLAEGGLFPGAIKVVAEWFPVRERALATGWFNAGSNIGAILCPIVVPWVYVRLGWPAAFYLTGGAGLVWVAAWLINYREPERHAMLAPAELEYIRLGQPAEQASAPKVSWSALLGNRAVWGYILASIFAGPAWGFYQFFLPDFLHKRFNPSLQAIGWYTGAFFTIAAIGGVLGGWLPAVLLRRRWTLNRTRKISLLICAVAVLPIYLAPQTSHIMLAVLIVGIAASAHQGWSANMYCVASDTLPKAMVSSTIGLGGFVAYFTGGFVNEFTGLILQKTGSYQLVFGYFSSMYLLALVALQILVPKIPESRNASEALEVELKAGHLITE